MLPTGANVTVTNVTLVQMLHLLVTFVPVTFASGAHVTTNRCECYQGCKCYQKRCKCYIL